MTDTSDRIPIKDLATLVLHDTDGETYFTYALEFAARPQDAECATVIKHIESLLGGLPDYLTIWDSAVYSMELLDGRVQIMIDVNGASLFGTEGVQILAEGLAEALPTCIHPAPPKPKRKSTAEELVEEFVAQVNEPLDPTVPQVSTIDGNPPAPTPSAGGVDPKKALATQLGIKVNPHTYGLQRSFRFKLYHTGSYQAVGKDGKTNAIPVPFLAIIQRRHDWSVIKIMVEQIKDLKNAVSGGYRAVYYMYHRSFYGIQHVWTMNWRGNVLLAYFRKLGFVPRIEGAQPSVVIDMLKKAAGVSP